MEDSAIVDLFWARNEDAIRQSGKKYGRLLAGISYSLLASREDAEECVDDTYVAAWNAMPDDRPDHLGAYLSKIVRRISIDRFRSTHRQKRGGSGADILLDELCECIPDRESENLYEAERLREVLNRFVGSLEPEKRRIFVLRYFYSKPLDEIAKDVGCSDGKVKTSLFRTRAALKLILEKEGLL